jgi:hypothetical protein
MCIISICFIIYDGTPSLLSVVALDRHGVVEPALIGAVVVVHVVLLDALVRRPLLRGDVPVPGAVPPQVRRATRRRAAAGAATDVEPPVPGREGPLGPVHLGPPAVRRPAGAVPDARADQHRLLRRERVPRHGGREVPQHPDRRVVHEHPVVDFISWHAR